MKFADLNGKVFRVVSATQYEILLQEEDGGLGGERILIKPVETEDVGFGVDLLDVFHLKLEALKP